MEINEKKFIMNRNSMPIYIQHDKLHLKYLNFKSR
jgi:hypothetical protein